MIGVLDPSEAADANQAAGALTALNSMIDAWNVDNLMVYTIERTVFPLSSGVQSYTLGTGGTFNMARPAAIENISILLTGTTPNIEIPIKIDQDEDWQGITVKSVTSSYPTEVYPAGDFPLNTLYFWPIPNGPCSVVLYCWNRLAAYTSVNDTVSLPPGFDRALRYNLAVELAAEYGTQPLPTVSQGAITSKASLRRLNWTPKEMAIPAYLRNAPGSSIGLKSRGAVVDP